MTDRQLQETEALVAWVGERIYEFRSQGLDAPSIASRYLSSAGSSSLGHDTVTKVVAGMYFR